MRWTSSCLHTCSSNVLNASRGLSAKSIKSISVKYTNTESAPFTLIWGRLISSESIHEYPMANRKDAPYATYGKQRLDLRITSWSNTNTSAVTFAVISANGTILPTILSRPTIPTMSSLCRIIPSVRLSASDLHHCSTFWDSGMHTLVSLLAI